MLPLPLKIIVGTLITGTVCLPAIAARPYHTDDPGTTEQGKFELETSVDYWNNSASPGIVFKHGITEKMELDIPVGYTMLPQDEKAFSPFSVYMKFSLIPDIAALTCTGAFAEKTYSINSILSHEIGAFRFIGNLGGLITENTSDADLTYNLCGTFTLWKIETGAEIGGTQEGFNWWQIGTKCFFTDWSSLDIGVGGDFSKNIKMNATTGLWFSFPISKSDNKGDK